MSAPRPSHGSDAGECSALNSALNADASSPSERERIQREIDEELSFHLAASAEALEGAGLGEREARRMAQLRFGDRRKIRRACLVQRQWRPIMLQRLHLATTLVLLVAAAFLGARSLRAEAAYQARLDELKGVVEGLQATTVVAQDSDARNSVAAEGPPRTDFSLIGVGDLLQIIDRAHPQDITQTCTVARDGMVLLPQAGWVMVAGKTLPEIDAALNEALSFYYSAPPSIVTMLSEAAPTKLEPDAAFIVRAGDQLKVLDEAHPDECTLVTPVSPDGNVLLPNVGRFRVSGLTRGALEEALGERYSEFYTTPPIMRVVVIEGPAR